MKKIFVIGGGASGMMAAIAAAEEGAAVTIVEHNDQPGKKILSTGNGRCNFTNTTQNIECYRGDQPDFAWKIIQKFDWKETALFFEQAGIPSKSRNGYLYPNSDQAASVRNILCLELARLHVRILTGCHCREILPGKRHFSVVTDNGKYTCDAVILAAGSKAAPFTGSDGSGYDLAKKLGHHLIPVLPALVQLKCRGKFYKSIAGVRIHGKVSIYADQTLLSSDTGEIQLTDYGISGIPVFQVSRYVSRALYEHKEVTAELNFMPEYDTETFVEYLKNRIILRPDRKYADFLTGLFPQKMIDLWLRLGKTDPRKAVRDLTTEELEYIARLITAFRTTVDGTNSYEQAQICCGGIDTRELNNDTLESLSIPNLYFAGEILDVDGICGGYNLQWAWSSGYVAGKEAAGGGKLCFESHN